MRIRKNNADKILPSFYGKTVRLFGSPETYFKENKKRYLLVGKKMVLFT